MKRHLETHDSEGFTLIELILGISILLVATMALGLSLQAGAIAARDVRELQVVMARAQTFLDRLVAQEFGHSYDPSPLSTQLEEVFDGDAEAGNVTLHQLSQYPPEDGGWVFQVQDFPVQGQWRVRVDRDLNDNAIEDGDLETGGRIFRISVFFDNRLILETTRSKEVSL